MILSTLIKLLNECPEFRKIDVSSSFSLGMSRMLRVGEICKQVLEEGIISTVILNEVLILDISVKREKFDPERRKIWEPI